MDEVPVKVKIEKVDPEIEEKIRDSCATVYETANDIKNINVKIETQQDCSDGSSSSSSESSAEQAEELDNITRTCSGAEPDKKNIELQKSSNELLAELFEVFNVQVRPDELFNDENLLKKAKKNKTKKSKKEKRKKHKKHKKEASPISKQLEFDENVQQDEKKEKHKHKKKKKHKSKDDDEKQLEGTNSKYNLKAKTEASSKTKERDKQNHDEHDRSKDRTNEKLHISDKSKKEKHSDNDSRQHAESRKRHATTEKLIHEPPAKIKFNIEKRPRNSFYNEHSSERKSRHTESREGKNSDSCLNLEKTHRSSERSFYNDHSSERTSRRTKSRERKNSDTRLNSEQRHKSSSRYYQRDSRDRFDKFEKTELSDLSLSDEETYLREKARPTEGTRRDYGYRTSRERHDFERRRRSPTPSRSRRRSRSRELGIDKKRLLEIARKNAISMFKRGCLPGCANMTEDVKDKVLLQMRYGGRTVQDLTDFCRKISNGEPLPELSSDNDSDVDKDGNVRAFHHPFQTKERDPMVLHLRNPVPIPVSARKEEQTKAITMQFPVSSGQEHRKSESWIPVEMKPTPLPVLPAATQSTNIFKQVTQKNVFEKTLPKTEQQEPAFKPVNVSSAEADSTSTTMIAESHVATTATKATVATTAVSSDTAEVTSTFVPDVPIPTSTTNESVFPEVPTANVDVSSIISKRLNALRRLQENPLDPEAIKIMYNSQKEMTSWVSSKHLPGQFLGSTGANVLRAHELNSGPQVWARRDQLTSTKPVTGGMGMHLLQKMGWKPGEGLGREKKGALQPLLLDVKLDKRGLVAKDDTGANGGVRLQNNKKRPNTAQEVIQSFQNKHPVCILNELTSKRKWTPPMYNLVTDCGPAHNKKFLFSVSLNGQTYQAPDGSNTKKEAKMLAAKFCLEQIGILPAKNS